MGQMIVAWNALQIKYVFCADRSFIAWLRNALEQCYGQIAVKQELRSKGATAAAATFKYSLRSTKVAA